MGPSARLIEKRNISDTEHSSSIVAIRIQAFRVFKFLNW
jgi:hypothetical protein